MEASCTDGAPTPSSPWAVGDPSAYRDPSPLPDGRVLVAATAAPLDPGNPAAEPDFGISVVSLAERPDGGGAMIDARQLLVDEPGLDERDPEPIVALPTLREVARCLRPGIAKGPHQLLAAEPQQPPGRGRRPEDATGGGIVEVVIMLSAHRSPDADGNFITGDNRAQ